MLYTCSTVNHLHLNLKINFKKLLRDAPDFIRALVH